MTQPGSSEVLALIELVHGAYNDAGAATALSSLINSEEDDGGLLGRIPGGLNGVDPVYGETVLVAAAGCGYGTTFELLLNSGAEMDLEAVDRHGRSLLLVACGGGNGDIIKRVLAAGASADVVDGFGQSPLQLTAPVCSDVEVFELLVAGGANVNEVGIDGQTALMNATARGSGAVALRLLELGADPGIKNSDGANSLGIAVDQHCWALAEAMCAAGADPSGQRVGYRSLLVHAAMFGPPSLVDALCAAGEDANARDYDRNNPAGGRTAIMIASRRSEALAADVVAALLSHGADPNLEHAGIGALATAVNAIAGADVLRVLLDGGADIDGGKGANPFVAACVKGHAHAIRFLVGAGVDPNTLGWPHSASQSPLVFFANFATWGRGTHAAAAYGFDFDCGLVDGSTVLESVQYSVLDEQKRKPFMNFVVELYLSDGW